MMVVVVTIMMIVAVLIAKAVAVAVAVVRPHLRRPSQKERGKKKEYEERCPAAVPYSLNFHMHKNNGVREFA